MHWLFDYWFLRLFCHHVFTSFYICILFFFAYCSYTHFVYIYVETLHISCYTPVVGTIKSVFIDDFMFPFTCKICIHWCFYVSLTFKIYIHWWFNVPFSVTDITNFLHFITLRCPWSHAVTGRVTTLRTVWWPWTSTLPWLMTSTFTCTSRNRRVTAKRTSVLRCVEWRKN